MLPWCVVYATDANDPYGVNRVIGLSANPSASNTVTTSTATTATTAPVVAVPNLPTAPATALSSSLSGGSNTSAAPVSITQPQAPAFFDYSTNLSSDVFGANLFTGSFARSGATPFNPDYIVNVGDNIQLRFWGAFEYDSALTVDPQGNIFVPHVGPVRVLGARNQDLQRLVDSAVRRIFRANVYSYASLAAAQPVRVYVAGFVNRPGLYSGTSMDSLLNYIDQAGGIDLERGSFLNIQIKRNDYTRATINLYDFILQGRMPIVQLGNGDVIFCRA
ncbi:polysaccharide biosynthesis/export family protein [Methylocucumis oryzae]|uniref:polysaccharide biosynthesis/export family protein n=1 Tax=Methylocucumis oryzae TaxID=1632867 RepID=UPI0006973719|nr:polysaccharide biosynthesis/export family protein [Methylocucumis oryzae]